MIPKRMTVKFFLQDGERLNLDDVISIFHGWIQDRAVEGLLVYVADYRHVKNGPGIVLVGDQVDYAIDLSGGQPGLLLRTKRRGAQEIPLQAQLVDALRLASRACLLLEKAPNLQGRIAFRTDEVEIAVPDRLHAPNTEEIFSEYSLETLELFSQLYQGGQAELWPVAEDQREMFALRARIPNAPSLDRLADTIEAAWSSIQA